MKKKIILVAIKVTIISLLNIKISFPQQANNQLLTFFIRPYFGQDLKSGEKVSKKLKIPGKTTHSITKNMFKELYNTGIFVSYMGNFSISDINGQIKFLRKTKSNTVNIVVSQNIKPVFMTSNTIHHFALSKPEDARWYKFDKVFDKRTKKYFWNVSEKNITGPNLPADILLISSKPSYIYIPTGHFESNDDPNLELPDIYAKQGISTALNAVKFFKVKRYFSPIKSEYKFDAQGYQEIVI